MATHSICSTASIVVFVLFFRTGISDIIVAPSSREVQLGGSTYFNCSANSTNIIWTHYTVSPMETYLVYGGGQITELYKSRFAVDKDATFGEYNLLITSVVAHDAGKYECNDDASRNISADLIVLDTDLMCHSNVNIHKVIGPNSCDIEPDLLILTCMVQYYGNEAPILQWRLNDNNESITNNVTLQINDKRVIYNLTMTIDQISYDSFYVCSTTRSTSKISCNSGNVKVVGSRSSKPAEVPEPSEPYKIAIIGICIFLLLPLLIGVVVLSLKLRSMTHSANRPTPRRNEAAAGEEGVPLQPIVAIVNQ